MSWLPTSTTRKVRAAAKKAGHDLSRLDAGGDTAIASCMNEGCSWMVEISGRDNWRFINLAGPTDDFGCKGTPESAARPSVDGTEGDGRG